MFSPTDLGIMLFKGRFVLGLSHSVSGSEKIIFSVKKIKLALFAIAWKRLPYKFRRFEMIFKFYFFCLTLSVLK